MTSLAQEDLPKDSQILKALAQHNRIDVAGALYPCAGVYAVAEATGTIRKDDRVSPNRAQPTGGCGDRMYAAKVSTHPSAEQAMSEAMTRMLDEHHPGLGTSLG